MIINDSVLVQEILLTHDMWWLNMFKLKCIQITVNLTYFYGNLIIQKKKNWINEIWHGKVKWRRS